MAKSGKIYYTGKDFTDAEVLANFAYPCILILRDNFGKIIKQTAYDVNGNKSVLEPAPLPDPTSENELAYKPVAEDEWRTLTIPSDSVYKISLGNSLSGEFWLEVDPAVTAPKIGGVLGKVSRIWDGRGFWIYNNSAKDIALVPESYTPPEFFFWFTFQEELVLEKKSWTYLKIRGNNLVQVKFPVPDVDLSPYALDADLDTEIVNRAMADNALQSQITTEKNRNDTQDGQIAAINARTSSVVDKMLHYWDSTAGKWLSSGVEFLGNAILKLKIISFGGYTIAQKNAIASPAEGMLIYQNESPKGFQKYENGAWTAVGSNISNADLSNVSARTFTQGNTFTWNTAGLSYMLKGLINRSGDANYSRVLVSHSTTGDVGYKSVDIVSYTDLSATFNGTVIPLNKLSGSYQMTIINYTTYTTSNLVIGGWAVIRINAPSEPVIKGATKLIGFNFLPNVNMYMYVRYNGSFVEYFFCY